MRVLALAAVALAACTPSAAERGRMAERAAATRGDLETALAGLVPGKPMSCLPANRTASVQTEGYGPVILYKYSRKLIYRSDTGGGCEGIARGDILVTRQVGGQLCSGDIATTLDRTSRFQTGGCGIGPFTPYRRP